MTGDVREEKRRIEMTRTALERAEDAIERADCYFDFGLKACATEIAVEINAAIAAERERCAKIAEADGATMVGQRIAAEIRSGARP